MIDPHLEEGPVTTTRRTLRQFAGLWIVFLGGLACWEKFGREHHTLALVLGGLALGIGLPGLIWPGFIRPLFSVLMAITMPIGWVVSHLLLGLLFYGIFTPLALFFRLTGRDALQMRRAPNASTYWLPKRMPTDVRSYFRQS